MKRGDRKYSLHSLWNLFWTMLLTAVLLPVALLMASSLTAAAVSGRGMASGSRLEPQWLFKTSTLRRGETLGEPAV